MHGARCDMWKKHRISRQNVFCDVGSIRALRHRDMQTCSVPALSCKWSVFMLLFLGRSLNLDKCVVVIAIDVGLSRLCGLYTRYKKLYLTSVYMRI